MGTEKRERQKAGRMARVEAEMAAQASAKRRRSIIRGVIIAAVVIGAIVLYSVFAGGDDDSSEAAVTTTAAPDTTVVEATTTLPPQTFGTAECPEADGSSPTTSQFTAAPAQCIDLDTKYVAEFETTSGPFEILLDPALDPVSANNFVFLARHHAYDGTIFHRIIEDFVVQGGDVQFLDGAGGPGYTIDARGPSQAYQIGSVAMANRGSDPSTSSSQFFVVTGDRGAALSPDFSLFGQVINGLEVPLTMQSVETDGGDKPVDDVVVDTVTIREATAADIEAYEDLFS